MAVGSGVPLGRRASIAAVLADLYGGLAEKRREKNKILALEDARNRQAMQEWEKARKEPLTVFHAFPRADNKESAEIDKIRAEIRKLNAEAASKRADAKSTREVDKLTSKLNEAYQRLKFLEEQAKNEKLLFNIIKERLKSKYDKGNNISDPNDLLVSLQEMEDRAMKMLVTYQQLEDEEGIDYAKKQLKAIRDRIRAIEPFTVDMRVNDLMPGSRPLMPEGLAQGGEIPMGSGVAGGEPLGQQQDVVTGAGDSGKMRKPDNYYFDRLGKYNMAKILKDVFSVGGKSVIKERPKEMPSKEDIKYLIWEATQEQKQGKYGKKSQILDELLADPDFVNMMMGS